MLAVLVLLALPLAVLAWFTCGFGGCPDIDRLGAMAPEGAPVLLTREGEPFAALELAEHVLVKLDDLPPYVPVAFIAVEDKRFRQHDGVDWRRVFGAVRANVQAGGIEEGSSTLTMQLARNVFPDAIPGQEKTLARKLKEVRVAQEIEEGYTKDEILELYLNHIYFGGGARGIEAASHQYFGHGAAELSLPEAALLAALPKAPTHYDPRRHPERAQERRNLVLDLMEEQARLEPEEAEQARQTKLAVRGRGGPERREEPFAGYFVDQVQREIEELFGDSLYRRPVRIVTTLDQGAQQAAEEQLERQLRNIEHGAYGGFRGQPYRAGAEIADEGTGYLQGAVVVLHATTGDVLAWVGGRDYRHSTFDRVTRAQRQVGSSFKPFVLATALSQGHFLSERISDQPLSVELSNGDVWQPANFGDRYSQEVTLRETLVQSKNVAAVRLIQETGVGPVVTTAERQGISRGLPEVPSLALGVAILSPLEMTRAYTAFANHGQMVEPRFVMSVEDAETGEVLWESRRETERVLDPKVAYLVTDVLRDVVDRGTARAVRSVGFSGPAAGKTGTTNEGLDVWFVGYTPELVSGVWIGFDRPQPIVHNATGGRLAAPIWGRMMRRIYRNRPMPGEWARPAGIVEAQVDAASGFPLAEGCRAGGQGSYRELFLAGYLPRRVCPGRDPGEQGLWARWWGASDEAEANEYQDGYEYEAQYDTGYDYEIDTDTRYDYETDTGYEQPLPAPDQPTVEPLPREPAEPEIPEVEMPIPEGPPEEDEPPPTEIEPIPEPEIEIERIEPEGEPEPEEDPPPAMG